MKKLALSKVFLLGLIASSSVNANGLSGVLGVGYGFGGDDLFKGIYTNGESDKIKANQGVSFFGGVDLALPQDFLLRGTIGYKFDSLTASNGEVTFDRVPLEFTAFKAFNEHKIGAGIAYHTAVTLECKITNMCDEEVEFDDAAGFTVQYEYAFAPLAVGRFAVGAKYTNIDYKLSSTGEKFDGSGFDFHLSYLF
ncbi:hypothetical protein BOO92_14655 [Vibrio navarrensis]|uniref:hypothetical protein n=1 Tax=Vibrio navarrensis TaxID=29495 RepID=UPI001DF0FE78|nr:hypothetical protein [Vibrio navarrensis]MBE3651493.1 hypothetical protein [Vibrio navarrensis]MBE3657916.1 hypothetical protein [Vibrio navarrensis]